MAWAFTAQLRTGAPRQLVIDDANDLVPGACITCGPCAKQLRHVESGLGHWLETGESSRLRPHCVKGHEQSPRRFSRHHPEATRLRGEVREPTWTHPRRTTA